MSGGYFDNVYGGHIAYEVGDRGEDEELNALFFDLFGDSWSGPDRKSEFGPNGGGLFEALDWYLAHDIDEDMYREQVRRFKLKWLVRRTPRNRVEFYQRLFEEKATELMERYKKELVEV